MFSGSWAMQRAARGSVSAVSSRPLSRLQQVSIPARPRRRRRDARLLRKHRRLPAIARAERRRFCCSAATTARSPRHNRRRLPRPCRTAGSSCLPVTATASICCNRSAARALLWNSGDLTFNGHRRNTPATGDSGAAVGAILLVQIRLRRIHRRDRPGCRVATAIGRIAIGAA